MTVNGTAVHGAPIYLQEYFKAIAKVNLGEDSSVANLKLEPIKAYIKRRLRKQLGK